MSDFRAQLSGHFNIMGFFAMTAMSLMFFGVVAALFETSVDNNDWFIPIFFSVAGLGAGAIAAGFLRSRHGTLVEVRDGSVLFDETEVVPGAELGVAVRPFHRNIWSVVLLDPRDRVIAQVPISGFEGEAHMQTFIEALEERGVRFIEDSRPDTGVRIARALDRSAPDSD